MPSYAQLEAESWWGREIVTDELGWCGDELCRRSGAPAYSIGTKGDNSHLNGGHRSQEWILNSDWCTNTHYTVQSGLTAEQPRHIAALDRTPGSWGTAANRAQMVLETGRLVAAGKAGKLVGITQIQGTLDGVNTYGINLPSLNTSIPDSSHLDHWHLTFDRRYLRDIGLMRRVVDTVLGEEDDMIDPQLFEDLIWRVDALFYNRPATVGGRFKGEPNELAAAIAELKTGGVDIAALAKALKPLLPTPPTAQEIATAVLNEDHKRSAD